MKTLSSLFITKKKASIRNLFKKPVPAILTVLAGVTMIGSFYPLLIKTGTKEIMDSKMFEGFALLGTYFTSMFLVMMLFQKRKSLFLVEDSYYLFIGPFSNKKIIAYLLFEMILSSLMLSLMSFLPIVMFGMNHIIPIASVVLLFVMSALATYTVMTLINYIYIKEMVRGTKTKIQQYLAYVIAAALLIILGLSMFESNFNVGETLRAFASSDKVNFVPIIGWIRLVLMEQFAGNTLIWCGVLGGIVILNVILTIALVNIKGDFYEQAMVDSEAFTEYYNNIRKNGNKSVDANLKSKSVTMTFNEGEMALFSKNNLIMKKTGGMFKMMDIVTAGIVIFIAYSFGQNILVLGGVTLFYAYNNVSTSSLNDDLKHHYVYLIPGKPLKKLMAVLILPIFKVSLSCILTLVIGGLLYQIDPTQILQGSLIVATFIIVFAAGNVVSIRLMGSRNGKISEMMIRMAIVTLALLPSIGIIWLMITRFGAFELALDSITFLVIGFNIAISTVLLISCSPMMNGHNISAD